MTEIIFNNKGHSITTNFRAHALYQVEITRKLYQLRYVHLAGISVQLCYVQLAGISVQCLTLILALSTSLMED